MNLNMAGLAVAVVLLFDQIDTGKKSFKRTWLCLFKGTAVSNSCLCKSIIKVLMMLSQTQPKDASLVRTILQCTLILSSLLHQPHFYPYSFY